MTPPPKGFGGVLVPPRDWGQIIEDLRAHTSLENERLEKGLLSLEKRYYNLQLSFDELSVALESIQRRIDEGKRDSVIDAEFESKVLAAISKGTSKSEPPDIEFAAPSGRRVRGNGWGVVAIIVLALVALAIVVIYRGPQFAGEIGKLLH